MNKIMIALAAVTMAVGVQAATVKWQASVDKDTYAGWNGYLYRGTSSDINTILSTVLAEDAAPKGWTDNLSLVQAASKPVTSKGKISAQEYTSASKTSTDQWTLVLFDGDIVADTKFSVMESYAEANYAMEGTDTPVVMAFGEIKYTGTLKVESVPEPTSGLLLLLGVAGLALRRRRA